MLGCLDARMPSFVAFLCTREHQSEDAGMPGCSDACQMSHLAFPCGREHQFEGQGGGGGLVFAGLKSPAGGKCVPFKMIE